MPRKSGGNVALVADTDRDTREMYVESLRRAQYDVEETEDGREALATAIARQPDIIITETRLIGINGYELCRLLKRDEATCAIPIVVVTCDDRPTDIRRAQQAGADRVLPKPCPAGMVLAEIGCLLQRSKVPSRVKQHTVLSHALHRRYTTMPPFAPPELRCPICDRQLVYRRSHIGGVSVRHVEQWDYFECATGCGTFQCRQRTRKLRKVIA